MFHILLLLDSPAAPGAHLTLERKEESAVKSYFTVNSCNTSLKPICRFSVLIVK